MEKLLLLIYLSSFYAMASDRNSTDVDIPTSSLTFSYMKDNFRELNVQMTPFSDSRDDDAVEEERQGSGWRFATSNYRKHKNVIFYNHGHGGRKKEYYKFSNDHPWREDRPRRDLWSMSDWFDKYNVSFYAPLRKETEDLDGNYGRSIEPVEVFHHLTNTVKKLYENDVNICYVGHSEGGASTLFASMYFNFSGNGDLFLNVTSYLVEEENLISIRPKERENKPLSLTSDQGMLILMLGVLAPVLTIFFGVRIWWRRRSL